LSEAVEASPDAPVLIDKFLEDAIEIDVDALSDGEITVIGGIMEHVEEAGIHSGDSACVLPPHSLQPEMIKTIKEAENQESNEVFEKIKEGLDLTYNQLTKVLEKNQIKAVNTDGEFDPDVHQAILQVESEEHNSGDIVQVMQKGYTIKERILRPAMVSTAK
jgi:hypothetical protein